MKYQPPLDGLRGIAVIFVVLYHARPEYFPGGWVGVDVFFVLSGFLITSVIRSEIARTGNFSYKKFFLRRTLRLTPALWALLIVALALKLSQIMPSAETLSIGDFVAAAGYFMNIWRAYNFSNGSYLGHTWSLSMEEQFYLLWPALLLAIRLRKAHLWLIVMLFSALCWRCYLVWSGVSVERTYNGPDTHTDALLIGCLLAMVREPDAGTSGLARYWPIPVATLAVLLFVLSLHSDLVQSFGLTIIGLLAAWMVIAALDAPKMRKVLSIAPLVFTGKISYGWYLWHVPCIIVGARLTAPGGNLKMLALSYAIASLSHVYVEAPFLRLKKRLEPVHAA